MKTAAIYARKSTGQHVAEDAKSVTRQIENAKAFAVTKGWTVDDRYIFVDDGVSGADARRLRERRRMIDLITNGRCPFRGGRHTGPGPLQPAGRGRGVR